MKNKIKGPRQVPQAFKGPQPQHILEEAFKLVQPETHWKDEILATVPAEFEEVCLAAIIHFTGTVGQVIDRKWDRRGKNPRVVISAPGYWQGPCN